MGRPKVPLIDRDKVILAALALIDRDGLEALTTRRLGAELGVNPASLYHHFADKDEILVGVGLHILQEGAVTTGLPKSATWQEVVTTSILRYRAALLRHPHAAGLLTARSDHPLQRRSRDRVLGLILAAGVPATYAQGIVDSAETLAAGATHINPQQLALRERFPIGVDDDLPHLDHAIRASPRTAEKLFALELKALLAGWTALIEQAAT